MMSTVSKINIYPRELNVKSVYGHGAQAFFVIGDDDLNTDNRVWPLSSAKNEY